MLGLAVAFLIAWGMPRVNEDLFVSLRCGAEALNRGLTAPDTSSFTREGQVFVNRGWLSHVLLHLCYSPLGDVGPLLAKGLLLFGCLVLLFIRCRQLGVSANISLFSLTLGTLALAPFLGIRAENFGMLCFVLMGSAVNGPRSWGRWRQAASLVVLVAWANLHGTFVLGFGFLALRVSLDIAKRLKIFPSMEELSKTQAGSEGATAAVAALPSAPEDPDLAGWLVILVLGVCLVVVGSPYGVENVRIPFNRLVGFQNIVPWNDYLPLLHWDSFFQDRLFKPFSVVPFLALTAGSGVLLAGLFASLGVRKAISLPEMFPGTIDTYFELAVAGMMVPLVFMWQRLILFAAPSFMTPVAILITAYMGICRAWASHASQPAGLACHAVLRGGAVALWVIVLAVALYTSVVRLYLSGNPTSPSRAERPLVSRMVHSHLVAQEAADFMKQNKLQGRVFATMQSADYLLLNVPGIQVFFDLRAHVAYPLEIFSTYYSIIGTDAYTVKDTLKALERYKVDLVVLDFMLQRRSFVLAQELMRSKKWGCIYKDDWIFILAPKDSKRFGPAIRACDLSSLRYARHEVRIVSQSVLSFFQTGSIPEDLLESLKGVTRTLPDPDVYALIVSATSGKWPCLTPDCKIYLTKEMARLENLSPNVAGGVPFILESRSRIAQALATSELLCGSPAAAVQYSKIKEEIATKIAALLLRYSVF